MSPDSRIVVIFTLPDCIQCFLTKNELDRRGAAYESVLITPDSAEEAYVKGLGYLGAPVVVVADGSPEGIHWTGFRPDLITKHIAPPRTGRTTP